MDGSGRTGRVLVTGATGTVGRRIVREALRTGATVATLGRRAPGAPVAMHFSWNAVTGEVPMAAVAWSPGTVIHAAAMTDVDECEDDPDLARRVNAGGTAQIADLARRCGARLLNLSTDAVFDGRRGQYGDGEVPNPVNAYGRSKLEGEVEARAAAGSLTVRFNVVASERLTAWILDSAATSRPIRVFTDVCFNPVEAGELAGLLLTLCASDLTGVCHVGSDETVSKAEYAERLIRYADLGAQARVERVRLADVLMRAPRPLNTSLLVSDGVLELAPMPNLDRAVRKLALAYSCSDPDGQRVAT